MKPVESSLRSHDGDHRLYFEAWKPVKTDAVLIFVHGLNEHSGRYQNPVKYFLKRNMSIYLFDHRGHGQSDGKRSYVDSFEDYLKDLHCFVDLVHKKEKNKKIFMVGHSMGGQIVINYVARYPHDLSGFVTSSANIQVGKAVHWINQKMALILSRFIKNVSVPSSINPKFISRDKKVVREYKKDPMVPKTTTLGLAGEVLRNQKTILKLAPKIKIPALLMHGGDDQICAKEGTQHFYKKLKSRDKSIRIYGGFYHEIFNEIGKEEVFKDMEKWLSKH